MKFNFKKISAIGASVLMTGMTMGVAAAANFPAPFVDASGANVAIVYGASAASTDFAQTTNIQTYLDSQMPSTGAAPTGDSVLIAKNSDNLNLGNGWSVFTGSIDSDDLPILLADGTYVADDNDEFDYEQKINLGSITMNHSRDSDYEQLIGADSRTPFVGFKLPSNTAVLNYTLDFTQDAVSGVASGDLDDIEGSDIMLFGKKYYVSDLKNGTSATYLGKLTLLDSAVSGIVSEGDVSKTTMNGKSYDVSVISFSDTDHVKLMVNGETTNTLTNGESYKLSDGTYVGVKEATKLVVSGSVGSVEYSLGTGKLEITSASDVKLNDDTIQGVKGYVFQGTAASSEEKINKIVIEWITDEEVFLSPDAELEMPGFGGLKFTMNDLVRADEEKITVQNDGDTSIELILPIKDGEVSLNLLYSESVTGNFTGIGKASDERLATVNGASFDFIEKSGGSDYHSYFVATYNTTTQAESYLLRAKVTTDTDNGRNETTIEKNVDGAWTEVCTEKAESDTCDVGDVSLTINDINYTAGGDERVSITGGSSVNFNSIYTAGGLRIYLPVEAANNTVVSGQVNFTGTNVGGTPGIPGHNQDTWYLIMDGEDKDDNIASGTAFNITIDDNSDQNLQVTQLDASGTGGSNGQEVGTGTSVYESYIVDDVAPRIIHYTKPDEDYMEVYYPMGDSETYAEVYLTESSSSSGSSQLGNIVVKDTEVSSVQSKNLIVVGGSCINSVAANLLGGAACGPSFTDKTDVAAGQYIIKSVSDAYTSGKIALVVAGYDAADTVAGVSYLTTQTVDTGKSYKGTSATSAEVITTTA